MKDSSVGRWRLPDSIQLIAVPNIDLPALCSPKFKPGPPVEEAQVYSNQLYDLLISYVA